MNSARGQVLIGSIIAIGIFSILSITVVTLVFSAYDLISYSRARTTARHIAEQEIENIRNLPYDNIGTSGGIPSGDLPQSQDISRNGQNYVVSTTIIYIDDPFDGEAPTDTLPTDYKRARVDVSWGGVAASKSNTVTLVTDIAPKGIETTEGGGTLSVLVFDSNGIAVPQADIKVVANSTSPAIDLSLQTNDTGIIVIPGAPTCINCYEITVSKEGYNTERTYSTAEVANPTKPHASVIEGDLTEISFAIDHFAKLNVQTTIGSQIVRIHGDKTIGTDSLDQPVYKFDQEIVTNSSGNLTIEELEWDNYDISLPEDSSYTISGTNPINPMSVLPEGVYNLAISLSPKTTNNLLITFLDNTQTPISSVSATLSLVPSFEETVVSGDENDPDFGQVFFSGLDQAVYQLVATGSGYVNFNGTSNVNGETTETVILENE